MAPGAQGAQLEPLADDRVDVGHDQRAVAFALSRRRRRDRFHVTGPEGRSAIHSSRSTTAACATISPSRSSTTWTPPRACAQSSSVKRSSSSSPNARVMMSPDRDDLGRVEIRACAASEVSVRSSPDMLRGGRHDARSCMPGPTGWRPSSSSRGPCILGRMRFRALIQSGGKTAAGIEVPAGDRRRTRCGSQAAGPGDHQRAHLPQQHRDHERRLHGRRDQRVPPRIRASPPVTRSTSTSSSTPNRARSPCRPILPPRSTRIRRLAPSSTACRTATSAGSSNRSSPSRQPRRASAASRRAVAGLHDHRI